MWAIKYRPQTLDNIVGNKEAIKLFKSFLKRPPKAILISGESGCGKTTIAKAFANDLGAVLYEFNVANTRGIDTVRTIIDMCKYRELGNKKRVILFDEAHQLTVDAQNALLKEVENYDDNIFIFSTTEPDDLIETLRNRCFHIKVYKLSVSECDKLINQIEIKEGIRFSEEVKIFVYKKNRGIPRGILNDLFVIREYADDLKAVKKLLLESEKLLTKSDYVNLCSLLINKNLEWETIVSYLKHISNDNLKDFVKFCQNYLFSVILNAQECELPYLYKVIGIFNNVNSIYELIYNFMKFIVDVKHTSLKKRN